MTRDSQASWTVTAPAKINLHLEVLGKRPDGYHELESLIVTISLADRLTMTPTASGTQLTCDDPLAGPAEDNLVTRAVELVRKESGVASGLSIELAKQTPIGAGLGGGSSDAAATLMGLNDGWRLGWDKEKLRDLGAQLGSDVPFFFDAPAAIVRGRGEVVTPIALGTPLDVVLVTPTDRLKTGTVFGNLLPGGERVPVEPIAKALERGDKREVADRLFNRLEEPALSLCPALRDIQREAKDWPCMGHRMTGSGSTYFALCASDVEAEDLGRHLTERNLGLVFVVRAG